MNDFLTVVWELRYHLALFAACATLSGVTLSVLDRREHRRRTGR